jgi:PmbA protein
MDPQEAMAEILKTAKKAGIQSAAAGYRRTQKRMVRFSNNSITVTNTWFSETPTVYLVSSKRRAACIVEEQNLARLRETVEDLAKTMKLTPEGDTEFTLPKGPFAYRPVDGIYDERVAHSETELIDAVQVGIDAAKKEGAVRVSGVVTSNGVDRYVSTSEGAEGSDHNTEIAMTIRAFASDEASGQGIALATNLSQFNPERAGQSAGHIAKLALNPQAGEAGKYKVVFGPSIFANLLTRVGDAASAYSVDLGFSFFQDLLHQQVASEAVTLSDNGPLPRSPGSASLDDEGVPTQENRLISNGRLEGFLHSSYTAAKQNASLTGSAIFEASIGGMVPDAHNIILNPGESSLDNLLDKAHDGLYVTNNWYTRFQNYRTGDFSTIIRDGVFRIINGTLAHPLKGLRLSDNMIRILRSVRALGRDREWVKWWEVNTPTLTPHVLVDDVRMTTASK